MDIQRQHDGGARLRCRQCRRVWDAQKVDVVLVGSERMRCCPDWECPGMGNADLQPHKGREEGVRDRAA